MLLLDDDIDAERLPFERHDALAVAANGWARTLVQRTVSAGRLERTSAEQRQRECASLILIYLFLSQRLHDDSAHFRER